VIDLTTGWNLLAGFEVVLFSSYTALTYKHSRKQKRDDVLFKLPHTTFVIPMYNEEDVIKEKIENTAKLNYPRDKLEIVVLNDYSTDNSVEIATNALKLIPFESSILNNRHKKGKANALNFIFKHIPNEITVITDADALLKKDSVTQIIKNFEDVSVGGATGKIIILSDKINMSKKQEESYRFFFDIWRTGESNLHSVTVCNGPLAAFRTKLLQQIEVNPNTYADDSDILFRIIQLGYRVLYEPKAIVYERAPKTIKGRLLQKMRRINGLKGVYKSNLNLLGKGTFGKILYPYALLTHIISPAIVLLLIAAYPFIIMQHPIYLIFVLSPFIPKIGSTIVSFMLTQFIMNFSFLLPKTGSWESISDARYEVEEK